MEYISENTIAQHVRWADRSHFERKAQPEAAKALGTDPVLDDYDWTTVMVAQHCLVSGAGAKDMQIEFEIGGSEESPSLSFHGGEPMLLATKIGSLLIRYWRAGFQVPDKGRLWLAGDAIRSLRQMVNLEVAFDEHWGVHQMPDKNAATRSVREAA